MAIPEANPTLDNALISVWHQALVEQKKVVTIGESTFSVRYTAKHRLAQIGRRSGSLQFPRVARCRHERGRMPDYRQHGLQALRRVMHSMVLGRFRIAP